MPISWHFHGYQEAHMPMNVKSIAAILGESPLVSLRASGLQHLWTARLAKLGHNLYRCAIRESASILESIANAPEVRVLLRDDLHGVVETISAKARILAEADPLEPGKVWVEIALDPVQA
jgi:hypothetical protein